MKRILPTVPTDLSKATTHELLTYIEVRASMPFSQLQDIECDACGEELLVDVKCDNYDNTLHEAALELLKRNLK